MQTELGVVFAASKHRRSFTVELIAVRQINGDLRIDDAIEDAPMLKIEFFDKFAELEDGEKDQIMGSVIESLTEIFEARNGRHL